MQSLPHFFKEIPDPRRAQGRRHPLSTVLAIIAAGATLCGMQGYLAIDGKTMGNAIDDQGYQTHIMSAIGHQTKACYTQKMRQLTLNVRLVFDYLRMTENSRACPSGG